MDKNDWQKVMRAISLLTQLGLVMVINIGVSFYSGIYIDSLLNKPFLFKIVGLIIGIISGFYSDYKLIIHFIENKD